MADRKAVLSVPVELSRKQVDALMDALTRTFTRHDIDVNVVQIESKLPPSAAASTQSPVPLPSEKDGEVRNALSAIVQFCDDPNGSEQGESLACGLARLLPAARAAIAQAQGKETP